MDMSEMAAALPDYGRRVSRETRRPERSHSLHESKGSTTYRDSARGAQIAVENSRRRRQKEYHYDDYDDDDGDVGSTGTAGGLEDREREVERYQAQKSGRTNTMPASAEALLTKGAIGAGSDNGSQKSRSTGSRGSGSGGESKNMNLMVNGLTIGFTEESVAGKNISIRAGDTGRVQLSIAGDRKPKQYIMSGSSYSDQTHQTGRSGRRELEEAPRRPREDLRSGASRRSSQSTYGGTRRHAR
jgi:hypothetical protein